MLLSLTFAIVSTELPSSLLTVMVTCEEGLSRVFPCLQEMTGVGSPLAPQVKLAACPSTTTVLSG